MPPDAEVVLFGVAYFCTRCGDLWAREMEIGPCRPLWYVREQTCRACGDGRLVRDRADLASLPRELLIRELDLALEHAT